MAENFLRYPKGGVQPTHGLHEATLFLNIAFHRIHACMMTTTGLPSDWVLRPAIDLELKQYTLLAYLQRVQQRFSETKLYPHLDELEVHHSELLRIQRSKGSLSANIHGDLVGFDPATGQAIHAPAPQPDVLDVIDDVIEFALPGLRRMIANGSELRQELTALIRFEPLGVQPLKPTEGWLFLGSGRETRVYRYAMPLLREHQEQHQYRSVVTRYHGTYPRSISHTYEHVRATLIGTRPDLPVPATFVFDSTSSIPYIETFMPLAKQLVYEHIVGGR